MSDWTQSLVHRAHERVPIVGHDVIPLHLYGRFFTDHPVERAYVTAEPVVRRLDGMRCKLFGVWCLALPLIEQTEVSRRIPDFGLPARPQISLKIPFAPAAPVARNDVAKEFKAVASCPSRELHRETDVTDIVASCAIRIDDALRWSQSTFGMPQLFE
jgi:hypothetical protein